MSLPADTASRFTAGDASPASEASQPVAAKSSRGSNSVVADEPLATAYEKRIHTLQDSLKERDQIVQMLTQRLEQAADQLDRMQRTGGGRGGATAAGIPPELIENQQTLAGQMTQLLGQWEALQAAEMLTRIESRLNDLHDLVSMGSGGSSRASANGSTSTLNEKDSANSSSEVSVLPEIAPTKPATMGWEAIKAAVMAGESINLETVSHSPPRHEAAHESVFSESVALERSDSPTLSEPPLPVDFDSADQQQLCDAIRDRDEFISLLLRRLSSPDASTEFPDWDQLNRVPEDLQHELLSLRDRLKDKLRVAEVDLSLQRAKLAREDARLTIKANQLALQLKKLGLAPEEPGSNAGSTRALNEGSGATQGRRWLQFLQRSGGNGSSTDGK